MKIINRFTWDKFPVLISSAAFFCGLMAFAYMGSFMRLIGDDYFLAANLKSFGFWGAIHHAYMNHVYFHGNRLGQTLILTFFSLFPPTISGILPILVIIVLVASIYGFITVILLQLNLNKTPLYKLNASLVIAFFTLFLAPTVTQGLYWRSAMVSSFGTHIGAFILGTLTLWKKPHRWYWLPLIFIYAFFNAGLSENGAVFQGMMAVLLIFFGIFLRFKGGSSYSSILWRSAIILIAAMAAIILMWESPGITILTREITISPLDAVILSFYHVYNFVKEILLSRTLDIALILLLGFCIFFLTNKPEKAALAQAFKRPLSSLAVLIIIQAISFALIFSIMLPSAYSRSAYPDPRNLIGAVFVLMFACLLTGYCIAALIQILLSQSRIFSSNGFFLVSMTGFMLISLVYPLTAIPKITAQRLKYHYWATQWDLRHDLIVQAAKAGQPEIHVLQMDHLIENVSELNRDPTSPTYNEPASIYYGITIIADQPGWDEGYDLFRKNLVPHD